MKPTLALLLAFAIGYAAHAQAPKPADADKTLAEACRAAKSVFLADLAKEAIKWDGKIVKLKWAGRDSETSREGDALVGHLWASGQYARVRVPAGGEAWFLRIKTSSSISYGDNVAMQVAYARVKVEGGRIALDLLGRELKIGSKGPELGW
ncbi:MAG: hypothetical protein ABMA13_18185 [Chthoniobacteraceae bacterium]